jgi:hypothetical protein
MIEETPREKGGLEPTWAAGYEPPRVERVLTPAALEREILYAGVVQASVDT